MKPLRIRSTESNIGLYRFLDWLTALLLGAAAVGLLLFVFLTPIAVKEETVSDVGIGDLVFADRIGKYFVDYNRGDIVVYRFGVSGRLHLGRVVAFGGERVQVRGGCLYINDAYLNEESYAVPFAEEYNFVFTVPDGEMLVLPDDRTETDGGRIDALTFSQDEIVGELRFRIYPFNKLDLFA